MREVIRISPFKCRMWNLHDRLGDEIDEESCRTLTDSMQAHGQKQAVLGRRVRSDPKCDVELIYGARRLFVSKLLGVDLSVEIRDIDDRAALIEMDIENRVRTDISAYERGLSYRRWLSAGFFSSQAEIAKCLRVSESQVSRLLRFTELPSAVLGAFPSPRDIREEWAVALAKHCRDENVRAGVLRRARSCRDSDKRIAPQQVYDMIIHDGERKVVKSSSRAEVVKDSNGTPVMRIAFRAKSVHFIVPRDRMTEPLLQRIKAIMAGALENETPTASRPRRVAKPINGSGLVAAVESA